MITNLKLLSLSIMAFSLVGCAADYDPDDDSFSIIEGNFPKLNTVPDRPAHATPRQLQDIQDKLYRNQEKANLLRGTKSQGETEKTTLQKK